MLCSAVLLAALKALALCSSMLLANTRSHNIFTQVSGHAIAYKDCIRAYQQFALPFRSQMCTLHLVVLS